MEDEEGVKNIVFRTSSKIFKNDPLCINKNYHYFNESIMQHILIMNKKYIDNEWKYLIKITMYK